MNPLYVVVREDLCAGMKMAQACHATRSFTQAWPGESVGENLVVLEASRAEIERLARAAEASSCSVTAFHEPDLGGELSAAAFGVGARPLLSQLRLARSNVELTAA